MKDLKIIILPHGWVFIGLDNEDGTYSRALNIRRWGTDSGLGQLALEGPQVETVLDKVGDLDCRSIERILIGCDRTKWREHYATT